MNPMPAPLTIAEIVACVQEMFPGVHDDTHWGERALFYNPGRRLPKGIYFLTFKEQDGANDRASKIAAGEYRLNLEISRHAFVERFGAIPERPPARGVVNTGHDFALPDRLTPHPVYGWMCWVVVKNPSRETFEGLKPLLAEAYDRAEEKFRKRMGAARRLARGA